VIHPGPWHVRILLEHALVVQPTVRILPSADDFLPVGANILDWLDGYDTQACRELAGAVCYAEHWYPQLTLVWIAYQTARIVVGELLNLEAAPLSMRGRDFQAAMLAEGKLPTQVLTAPPAAMLSVNGLNTDLQHNDEVEFLED
jgi:hypothetical protein